MKATNQDRVCRSLLVVVLVFFAGSSFAQRAGQSVTVQYGFVSAAQYVDLQSSAVPTGAVVGGTIGLLASSGKSSGKKARNTFIGTAAGATAGSAARGPRNGMLYSVQMGNAGMVQVVSDQREIRIGDCVAVERVRETANVRRVSTSYCDANNGPAIAAVKPMAIDEAEECQQAKQQLVEAETTAAADLAAAKIRLLCAD